MRKVKPRVLISIVPSGETNSWPSGVALLDTLIGADGRLMPEKVGNTEPLKVSVTAISECAPFWAIPDGEKGTIFEGNAQSFMWTRGRSPKSSGHVIHRHRNIHGRERPGWIIFRSEVDRKIDWYEVFRSLCLLFNPLYATLHVLGELERDSSAYTEEERNSFGFNDHVRGLPYVSLKEKGLANISWANYFGPDLKGDVRQADIRDAKFLVEEIGDGVMLRVTDNLLVVADDFDEFSRRRNQLRTFFRDGMFRINREPRVINGESSEP